MTKNEGRVTHHPAPQQDVQLQGKAPVRHLTTASREVSAAATYLRLAPLLAGDFPLCGTAAWCSLPDTNSRWWSAVGFAAVQQVLAQDIRQDAEREASRAISAAIDWAEFARQSRARRAVYIPRRPT